MFSNRLRDRTLKLIKHRDRTVTLEIIAIETGLTRRWLEEFLAGNIDDPGVVKVETLYVFLTGGPLLLEPELPTD